MKTLCGIDISTIGEWSLILLLLVGIRWFRTPGTARRSTLAVALGLIAAVVVVVLGSGLERFDVLVTALVIGTVLGVTAAFLVNMVTIPSLIALQNGAGGFAAAVVAFVELESTAGQAILAAGTPAVVTLGLGTVTAGGSVVACGKLAGWLRTASAKHAWHNPVLVGMLALGVAAASLILFVPLAPPWLGAIGVAVAGGGLGVMVALRVGGADMPVLISVLNACSGVSAALAGVVMHSSLLIACGAAVASSGLVLTAAMCRAMNRKIATVLFGQAPSVDMKASEATDHRVSDDTAPTTSTSPEEILKRAAAALWQAQKVIVVPGYGMALARAQFAVAEIAQHLEALGHDVIFAIHPVAGRMPGHMYVLLAEAGVEHERMLDIEAVNERFESADLALVVGACDVVNPAAAETAGTPISGMPILLVHQARTVVVCNLDTKPGYSGVENPLYKMPNTLMLQGDAKATMSRILQMTQE